MSGAQAPAGTPTLRDLLRSFEAWREQHPDAIPFPLRCVETPWSIEVVLDGVHPALCVHLALDGVDVPVNWQGENWDRLVSEDLVPLFDGAEWLCTLCEPEVQRPRFASLEALWVDHLFQPLARWATRELFPATHLVLSRSSGGGATWARLHKGELLGVDASDVVLPVRVPHAASS